MTAKEIKENRKKIHEILDIVLDTNGLEGRTVETTGTLPTIFFGFSGHSGIANIDVFENGWVAGACCSYSMGLDVAEPISDRDVQVIRLKLQDAIYNKHGVKSAELRRSKIMREISEMEEELGNLEEYIREQKKLEE